jgi:2-amino-4-hydroxy-6-hydroxymethyldihydropteridine diphosphokinase
MGTLALIGLGSNLGDRKEQLDAAIAAMRELPGCTLRAVSSYHETAPVGGPGGQGAFLNAAASVETSLEPLDLLRCLQDVEKRAGRVRTVRWGERTLDLDLLLFGDRVIRSVPVVNRVYGGESFALQVPHPRMALRRFVLAPLAEIARDAVDPHTGRSIGDLLANLDRRPSLVSIGGLEGPLADTLLPRLIEGLNGVGLTYRNQYDAYGRLAAIRALFAAGRHSEKLSIAMTNECKGLFESLLERLCHDLSRERRPVGEGDDRWLVTDLWIDEIYAMALLILDEPSRILDRLVEARRGMVAPTFVVVQGGSDPDTLRHGRLWPRPLGDAPILELHPDTPIETMTAEVLTACRATRTGG